MKTKYKTISKHYYLLRRKKPMTYEERLYSMRGAELIQEAERVGAKIAHKGTALKESKDKAVAKILAVVKTEEVPVEPEEETRISETPETEVTAPAETEPEKEEPAKKQRKPRTPKAMSEDITKLLEYIEKTWEEIGSVRAPEIENAKFKALCAEGGRQVAKLMWTTKKISLFVRVEVLTEYAEEHQKINYGMPFQCMFYHNTAEVRKNLKKLLTEANKADAVRKKKEKETKKAA